VQSSKSCCKCPFFIILLTCTLIIIAEHCKSVDEMKVSTQTSCPKYKTASCLKLTLLLKIHRMLRNTYIYENRMFTNKVNAASLWVGKEKG